MKSVVKILTPDVPKFLVACDWAQIKVVTSKVMGPKTAVEISFPTGDNLLEAGSLMVTLKDTEVKTAVEERMATLKAQKGGTAK